MNVALKDPVMVEAEILNPEWKQDNLTSAHWGRENTLALIKSH